MSKKGVSKISGNASPKVGEATTYTVTDWYPATPENQRNVGGVTWELFKKRSNGRFTTTNIKKTGSGTFTFGEVAQRNTYRLEAYLYEPEGDGTSTIEITPQPVAIPRINKVELQYVDDSPGTVFSYTEKMRARAQCVNLTGQKLKFSLWEDDAVGDGHNANNLLIETKEATVDRSGVAVAEFILTRALMQKAMQGETDPQKLEFYVTVEYFQDRKHATDNVNVNNPSHVPATIPQQRPQQPASNPTPAQPAQTPTNNNVPPRAANSPAANKPQSQKEEKGIVDRVTDWWNKLELWDWAESPGTIQPTQPPTQQPTNGRTVSTVEDSAVEDILDAYFAKKEYTKQTGEVAGTFEYKIGSNGNKTSTDAEKESIAKIILEKPAVKALVSKKEYTTLAAIKQGMTKDVYNKDESITFQTFKLGAELKKINNAPLEDKVYLVARTSGLNGKQATLIVKEKDGLIKGSAGAVFPLLEITEAQMEQATPAGTAVPGTEKTQFTGTIENGFVKVPIHLRPKSDDELKQWKEKVTKGKEDGEYTYKFGGDNIIADENAKKRVAETILRNAKNGNALNTKIADGKSGYIDDIIKALEIKTYKKDDTVKFKLYKKQPELLFIQAKAQGQKQHDKEFLKADGAYFEIAKKCPRCNAPVTAEQLKEIFTSASDDTLTKVAEAYTKYMAELGMNTCWNKAHFFAQAYVESGLGLHVKDGENFNYYYEGLSIFGAFQTDEGRRKARLWGRAVRTPSTPGVSLENQKNIANYAYSPPAAKATELGNTEPNDGWDFRGKGLVQLTGRTAYEQANVYTNREGKDIITNPDLVISDISVAVISSMVFFKWKGINKITYGKSDTLPISRKVGKEVGTSYTEKQNAFDQHTKITFKTSECRESDDSGAWKNPLASSQRTYYNSGGNHKEQNGAFGPVRTNSDGTKKNHQGLDIFAEPNTECYACLDGEVVSYTNEGSDGYGNVLVLKVKGESLRNAKRSYTHEFTDEVESGEGFDINAEYLYLRYAHLSSASVTSGEVKAGDPICYTGDSGNASGAVNPHLHFEVAKNATSNGRGLQNRYNPAYFVRLDTIDEPLQTRVKNER